MTRTDSRRRLRAAALLALSAFLAASALTLGAAATNTSAEAQPGTTNAGDCLDTSPKPRAPGVINVHLVPHTHDDVGWLKTLDQYYIGSKQDIYKAGVQYILDTVTDYLLLNPDRKFTYVEMAFFTRWWNEQTEEKQQKVRKLVQEGQLNFANGGWCMHDEAAAHYVGMVDQTTRGHRFLKETFDYVPRIGWQLDPFGHSATQGYLMGVDLGFDAMVLGRSDHVDLSKRKREQATEMLWSPSQTFGTKKTILTQIRPDGNYGPPPCFCFDFNRCYCAPIQDDERLEGYNVDHRVEEFIHQALKYSKEVLGDDIMFLMGSDFQWENADVWYKNLDKLIHYANKDSRVNVFYSSPEEYFKQKRSANITFPTKTDDFFPYSDDWQAYWTGYFTSRPSQKRYAFRLTSYLQSARQMEYFLGGSVKDGNALDKLEDAVSTLMHHDAITGTARQACSDDYIKRLSQGEEVGIALVNKGFKEILQNNRLRSQATSANRNLIMPPLTLSDGHHGDGGSDNDFVQCRLLNVSSCEFTEASSKVKQNMQVVVYNNLAQPRSDHVHLPIDKNTAEVAVFDGQMKPVVSQMTPLKGSTIDLGFDVTVPPKGMAAYYVMFTNIPSNGIMAKQAASGPVSRNDTAVRFGGSKVALTFDGATGLMSHFENKANGVAMNASVGFVVYNSSANNGQNSGAYIFRPDARHPTLPLLHEASDLTLVEGPVFSEMKQTFAPWVSLSTRVYASEDFVELLWNVGPIPFKDGLGKEVSMRISSQVDSGKTFYTDSNGREMLKRIVNYRPTWNLDVSEPVAGNYYPLTAALAVKDETREMSVLMDRACGGSSLNSGELEFMIHRRMQRDDDRGVAEALNETECGCRFCHCSGLLVSGRTFWVVDELEAAAQKRRILQQKQQEALVVAFRAVEKMERVAPMAGLDDGGLPENVNLMTFHALNATSVLVRFAHMYQAGESQSFSTPSTVDMRHLFPGKTISLMEEVSLSANQKLSDAPCCEVKVEPMQVRTFIVTHSTAAATAGNGGVATDAAAGAEKVEGRNPSPVRRAGSFI